MLLCVFLMVVLEEVTTRDRMEKKINGHSRLVGGKSILVLLVRHAILHTVKIFCLNNQKTFTFDILIELNWSCFQVWQNTALLKVILPFYKKFPKDSEKEKFYKGKVFVFKLIKKIFCLNNQKTATFDILIELNWNEYCSDYQKANIVLNAPKTDCYNTCYDSPKSWIKQKYNFLRVKNYILERINTRYFENRTFQKCQYYWKFDLVMWYCLM